MNVLSSRAMTLLAVGGCIENGLVDVDASSPAVGVRELRVEPASLDFGTVDGTAALVARVTSTGDLPVDVRDVVVTGSSAFTLDASVPTLLAAGEGFDVVVTYAPVSADDRASLIVESDAVAPRLVVPLAGAGREPGLAVDPPSLWFDAPGTLSVVVTSTGTADLVVSQVLVQGAGFSVDGAVPVTLPPGSATVVDVTWTPETADPPTGMLWLATNTLGGTARVPLAGEAGCDPAAAYVASTSGTVRSPCAYDVSAILSLGGDVYATYAPPEMELLFPDGTVFGGTTDGVGAFSLERITAFDFLDGCLWEARETLEGTVAADACSMTATYRYREAPIEGTGCWLPCTIDSEVVFDQRG